jgi:ankyrin repeat protein
VNELRANREAVDGRKHTALHFAASVEHESAVRLLVKILHVNKDAKNLDGKTALDITREL